MWLWLYWQAQSQVAPETVIRLTLQSDAESIATEVPLSEMAGSLADWQAGQVRRTVYHLPTSPRLSGAEAILKVAVITPEATSEIPLTSLTLLHRPHNFVPPTPQHPSPAVFGDPAQIRLLGYDFPQPDLRPDETLPLTLYWQAEAEMTTNYTVFVQLLNETGQVVAQVDAQPQAGTAPTPTWLPGEILSDPYTLTLPPTLPPGTYRLIAGLYDATTGARLPLAGQDTDFVSLRVMRLK
jgi:hypothetical protein